ncbi:MAG TPA: hypothetical protein VKZ84_01225 [Bacteriovoracaceae bacterium]|nr:hypothetical protein [Bacteriovoracaceae bacterium]
MLQHIKYYFVYQLIYVAIFVLMSSLGAFFHFLLDHEISVVESWLHNNTWEMIAVSKFLSLFLIIKWFSIRLYEFTTFRELLKRLLSWPKGEAIVISAFSFVSFVVLGKFTASEPNYLYWYHYLSSYLGIFLFFALEFVVMAYLNEVLHSLDLKKQYLTKAIYLLFFIISYKITIPDYYNLSFYIFYCFGTLLYLSDKNFNNWSNIVCFLILFICPMASLFGLDPVWGSDFSYFRFQDKFNNLLMTLVWLISFCYYKFRNQFIYSYKKLKR